MNDDFIDIENDDQNSTTNNESFSVTAQALHAKKVRKRIDDLLEKRRLKELLDDEDDWKV